MRKETYLGKFYFSSKELRQLPSKKKTITRADFETEEEYLSFVGNAMKNYLEYLSKNGKI